MGIISGFVEGIIRYDNAGTPETLPFQDKITTATFNFQSEALKVETFSNQGIKGMSAACPFREMATWTLNSNDITWAFIQAATGHKDESTTLVQPVTETLILSTVDATPDSTIVLPVTPETSPAPVVSDENGVQYTATLATNTITLTGAGDLTGTKVTVNYWIDASTTTQREINLGNPVQRITNVGLYGQFFGCPDSYLIVSNNVILEANMNLEVGENPAELTITGSCLRDPSGSYARIIQNPQLV